MAEQLTGPGCFLRLIRAVRITLEVVAVLLVGVAVTVVVINMDSWIASLVRWWVR